MYLLKKILYLKNPSKCLSVEPRRQHPGNRSNIVSRLAVQPSKSCKPAALFHREHKQHIPRLPVGLVQIGLVLRQRRPHPLRFGQRDVLGIVGFDHEIAGVAEQVVQLGQVVVRLCFGSLGWRRKTLVTGTGKCALKQKYIRTRSCSAQTQLQAKEQCYLPIDSILHGKLWHAYFCEEMFTRATISFLLHNLFTTKWKKNLQKYDLKSYKHQVRILMMDKVFQR